MDGLEKFWRWQVRRPRLAMLLALIPALIALSVLLALRPVELDPSQQQFRVLGDRDIQNYETFLVARQTLKRQRRLNKSLTIVYNGHDGDNMITADRLQLVHELETRIRAHSSFRRHCRLRTGVGLEAGEMASSEELCQVPHSFVNFLYPSTQSSSTDASASPGVSDLVNVVFDASSAADDRVEMDGRGSRQTSSVKRALQLLLIAGRDGFFDSLSRSVAPHDHLIWIRDSQSSFFS